MNTGKPTHGLTVHELYITGKIIIKCIIEALKEHKLKAFDICVCWIVTHNASKYNKYALHQACPAQSIV